MSRLCYHLLVVAAALVVSSVDAGEPRASNTWKQWRGPGRDSTITGTAWPDKLDEASLTQTWRVPLGPSYSSPIVSEDRVFVTETVGAKREVVRALDRKTGKQLWEATWAGSIRVPFFAAANGSWIRATPALDGNRLYVSGIKDLLVCLDATSGKKIWQVDFAKKFAAGVPSFGAASSPLVLGDHLYVQAGGCFAKLDKRSGDVIWRTLQEGGGMMGGAFSSPYPAEIGGVPQMLVQTRSKLAGVDPADGKVLWQQPIPSFRGMNIVTPTVVDGKVFTSSYGGGSFLFEPVKSEPQWKVEQIWKNRAQGYMSSPVVIEGRVYLHLRNQRFTCLDASSGKSLWTSKTFGKYWSMVANGDKILALDERGDLFLIKANEKRFELLDRRKLADNSWAHLAVCGDDLFIRELDAMTVLKWR